MGAPTSVVDAPAAQAGHRSGAETGRPWYVRLEAWAGLAILAACCVFVLLQQQLHLILRDTTTAGGDTGAHVWWPAYLRDHLLPQWRLGGWTPDFYAGFPAGQFYFPLPALLVVVLDVVVPYNVAFKVVTALGPVLLPVGAYVLGRGLRATRPAPAAMALAATAFLFFKGAPGTDPEAMSIAGNQRIMGGVLASNLAGEFSFTIALAIALAFLGTLAWALDHRRRAWLPAVLLAATVLSHLVVGVFAAVGAVIVWLAHRPVRNFWLALTIGGVGTLLTAVWTLPLFVTLGYTNDMGYETIREYVTYLFPSYFWYLYPLVAVALVVAVWRRSWCTLEVAALTAAMGIVFRVWDVFDTPAWNLRFLPFWYLGLYLLAGMGAADVIRGAAWAAARTVDDDWWTRSEPGPDLDAGAEAHPAPEPEPGAETEPEPRRATAGMIRSLTVIALSVVLGAAVLVQLHRTRSFLDFWARYNYTGYERADYLVAPTGKSSDEYFEFVETADALPPGRMVWEPDSEAIGAYGTSLALMLLPYWTDGRIPSMEGVYYEASATAPYHFLAVATLSAPGKASNPVRGLPYRTIEDFDLGVRYLQLLGVRYFAGESIAAKERADANPDLDLVAGVPDLDGRAPLGWNVYEVADAPLVEPLTSEPVVVEGVGPGDWRDEVGVPWFNDPADLDGFLAAGGPSDWPRAPADEARERAAETGALPDVRVTAIEETDDSISFRVSRTGVPVLVKASYFPNWTATGAEGPWRATPNLMIVVPTSEEVRLEYGTTPAEWLGRAGTVAGLGGVVALAWWWRPRRRGGDDVDGQDGELGEAGEGEPAAVP
ncbi:MAG TPA: hypothetical protein VF152_05005 [Acidimicrobiia bacterium]